LDERKVAMNATELKEKTLDQLQEMLADLKKEAFNLRFQAATNQLENTSRMRSVKKDVARVKTIINQVTPVTEIE
jgi:large subunit ribosomal protein L29